MSDPWNSIVRPTLLLDEARARRNIAAMAAKARRLGLRFRPHFKTHQSAAVGEWFRHEGVSAITVSSPAMAEYFAAHGWDDILVAFPLNPREIDALRRLAARVRLGVLIESAAAARFLREHMEHPLDVWLEIDAGYHRSGMDWRDLDAVSAAARAVREGGGALHLRGLLSHNGLTYGVRGAEAVRRCHGEALARLRAVRDGLAGQGVSGLEISVGDTPACSLSDDFSGVDEIRPGNFVLYDAMQYFIGSCRAEQIAAAVLCPVTAVYPARGEVVIHGGAVHLAREAVADAAGRPVFGLAAQRNGVGWGDFLPDTAVARLSQEHGVVSAPAEMLRRIHPGDLLPIIPSHSCLTVAAMGGFLLLDGRSLPAMPRPQ